MNFMITGSRGLIGQALIKRLLKEGHKCVMEIDQRCGSNLLSLESYQLTPSTQHIDVFFHLAAFCKINECVKDPKLSHLNNANGTFQALEFCRRHNIKKFVYMSSSRVLSPERNPYTASKVYGEELCKSHKNCYGIDYLIIRPSTVYGEHHDLTTRLLTKWVINALTNKPIEIYGDKFKTLDFTHVDDFVEGVMCLINWWQFSKNDSYDICGDDCRNLLDVANMVLDKTNSDGVITFEEPEIAQPQQVKIDISKIKEFGYEPKIKLEEGIERLINF